MRRSVFACESPTVAPKCLAIGGLPRWATYRQRVAAVKTLQELGLIWSQGAWQKVSQGEFVAEADAMHTQLVRRADDLAGCTEGSPEAAELAYRLARRGKLDPAEARSHIWCLERIGVRLEAVVLERIEQRLAQLGGGRVIYDGDEEPVRPAISAH